MFVDICWPCYQNNSPFNPGLFNFFGTSAIKSEIICYVIDTSRSNISAKSQLWHQLNKMSGFVRYFTENATTMEMKWFYGLKNGIPNLLKLCFLWQSCKQWTKCSWDKFYCRVSIQLRKKYWTIHVFCYKTHNTLVLFKIPF